MLLKSFYLSVRFEVDAVPFHNLLKPISLIRSVSTKDSNLRLDEGYSRASRGQGIRDKGATACVRTEQGIPRCHFIDTLIPLVVGLADRFIAPC